MKLIVILNCLLAASNAGLVKRIFRGIRAPVLMHPALAVIVVCVHSREKCKPICGAIVYTSDWISSTGHCASKIDSIYARKFVFVQVGSYDLADTEPTAQQYVIKRIYIHENYDNEIEGVRKNDIAMIKLFEEISFNEAVGEMPLEEEVYDSSAITMMLGWGVVDLKPNGREIWPNTLRMAVVDIINSEECQNLFRTLLQSHGGASSSEDLINNRMICTGPVHEGISACEGDFGGPLVQYVRHEKPRIIGLISYAVEPCGHVHTPTVHTKISEYLDWIKNKITYDNIHYSK